MNSEKNKKKTEYIDVKKLFRPWTLILLILTVVLSFVAVKLVAGGLEIREGGNVLKGNSILGESDSFENSEISEVFQNAEELSLQLSKLESTHTEWTDVEEKPEEKGFFCIGTSADDTRLIYNLDPENLCNQGYSFDDFEYFWVDSINNSFYTVINIPGEVIDLEGYYILVHDDTGNLASRLVINCYEAKTVKIKDAIITGTLLAPYANVECDRSTSVSGQVLSKGTLGSYGYYKEIVFGGYKSVMTVFEKVGFSNVAIRGVALDWLKDNYPEIYGNYSEDYVLNTMDAERITELVLDDVMIADMGDDLNCFKNLKRLSVRRTKLTALDVSVLTDLVELDISETDINSITVVPDSKITTLTADDTKLTELDVSNMPSLKKLSLAGTVLEVSVDYAKIPMLKELSLSDTGFKGFSAAEKDALSGITSLDLSDNHELIFFDFKAFKSLTSLNVSDCAFKGFFLDGADALVTLNCSYNEIDQLDLTPAKNLKICEAYGESFKKIVATGMDVRVGCFEKVTVEK